MSTAVPPIVVVDTVTVLCPVKIIFDAADVVCIFPVPDFAPLIVTRILVDVATGGSKTKISVADEPVTRTRSSKLYVFAVVDNVTDAVVAPDTKRIPPASLPFTDIILNDAAGVDVFPIPIEFVPDEFILIPPVAVIPPADTVKPPAVIVAPPLAILKPPPFMSIPVFVTSIPPVVTNKPPDVTVIPVPTVKSPPTVVNEEVDPIFTGCAPAVLVPIFTVVVPVVVPICPIFIDAPAPDPPPILINPAPVLPPDVPMFKAPIVCPAPKLNVPV